MLHLQFSSSDHEDDLGFNTLQFGESLFLLNYRPLQPIKIALIITLLVVKMWKTVSHSTVIQGALILIALL
jgi:hypothetical protein